jgi:hypothetical protein
MQVFPHGIISTDIIRTDGIMTDSMHWKEFWDQEFLLFSRIIITEAQSCSIFPELQKNLLCSKICCNAEIQKCKHQYLQSRPIKIP